MLHNHLRNFTSHELGIDLHASDKADNGTDGVNQLGAGIEIRSDHIGSFRNSTDTVALGKCPIETSSVMAAKKNLFFMCRNF